MSIQKDRAWFRNGAVYQIYPRSFQDSDGDGIGDLRGIIRRLDYIQSLGVSAVWVCPIYASPNDDNGYDISDYRSIQPELGTMDDFDALVSGLRQRGLRLILDMVVNHTSDEHPWFKEAKENPASRRRGWYIWNKGNDGGPPNRWASYFGGSAWELEPRSGEYYLHLFSKKQPDLNWENSELRGELHEMMQWWLAKGVDGFRLDAINLISKAPGFPEGRSLPGSDYTRGFEHWVNGPRIHEYLRELNEKVFEPLGAMTVGEMPGVDPDLAVLYTDPARRELDMIHQFEMADFDTGPKGKFDPLPMSLATVAEICRRWQHGLASRGWNSLFWGNHDTPRAISRYGDDGTSRELSGKALAAFLYLQKGTPFIYQGEEIGMINYPFTRESDLRDIESLNFLRDASSRGWTAEAIWKGIRAKGRDNARTPMCWSPDTQAGFTRGEPWIAIHPRSKDINAEESERRGDSLLAFYRRLLALRKRERLVGEGEIEFLDTPPALAVYRRWSRGSSGKVLWVGCNLSSAEVHADESTPRPKASTVLGNYEDGIGEPLWRPWETRVWYE